MHESPQPLVAVLEGSDERRAELVRLLAACGCDVATAADAEQGLREIDRATPDAVLLDHELPGGGGMELLDRLRATGELAAVPVIVLTSRDDPGLAVAALRRGAHDLLQRPYDDAELEARVLAALRVKALHDALVDANRRLAAQALTDDLTGLANRRHGAHELDRAVALAVRHGRLLALARIDVDRFKDINDTHGHQAGDLVLAAVARRLASALRGGDELARWGGDEFVALLPDTSRAGALRAASRLRAAVAEAPVQIQGGEIPVTVSVGWAHWAGDTPDDLLARADRALYKAKDAGRNAIHPPEEPGSEA
jgi:diguanylate cyclase (GGDEF)-like protein